MPKKKPASKQPSRPTPLASRLPRVTYPDYDAVFRPEDGIVRESPEVLQPSRLAYRDDARLLGVWVSFDQDEQKMEYMTVRKLDDATYVVAMDDDLYRAFHSDFVGTACIST